MTNAWHSSLSGFGGDSPTRMNSGDPLGAPADGRAQLAGGRSSRGVSARLAAGVALIVHIAANPLGFPFLFEAHAAPDVHLEAAQ